MARLIHPLLRALAPAIPRPTLPEAIRAAIGAGIGLFLTGILLYLITPTASLLNHPLLIAPFAASAVLIFAVPNSPLAQPWAVVVGNTAAALIGLATIQLYPQPLPAAAIAVLLTLLATAPCAPPTRQPGPPRWRWCWPRTRHHCLSRCIRC